jgi:ketosteroid isomerase-like protein
VSEAKKTLEQAIDRWNAADREGWAALYTDDVVYEAPGGSRISGLADLKKKYFDALLTAAPDRESTDVILFAEGDHVVEEARYVGSTPVPGAVRKRPRFPQLERSWTSPSSGSSESTTARSALSASTTTKSKSSP